jgi:colanic acid biosynthesis glycosyl transferase WcaI
MRIQLWSYNFAPEPTGIAPVSTALAEALRDLGHEIEVISAHPHYPEPVWGHRRLPYRDEHQGIPMLRLPLWVGRDTTAARIIQELTFTASLSVAAPFLSRPDVVVAASPSFPALLPAIAFCHLRRVPFVPWLHDILPDGAMVTGHVDETGLVYRGSRWLERRAYSKAARIVVLSRPFAGNLVDKGVPEQKISLIYDPATREPDASSPTPGPGDRNGPPRVLCMGNIGHTQGLAPLVRAFDRSEFARSGGARLVLTGWGVAAEETKSQIEADTVDMPGIVDDETLERELRAATLAMVSQQYEGTEFNLPSKIMNYMAYGLPIIAAVNPASETARLVNESGSGWVVDSSDPDQLPRSIAAALADPAEIERRAQAGLGFAERNFTKRAFGENFERLLSELVG